MRDVRGATPVSVARAYTDAGRVITLERHLALFHEEEVQHFFLSWRPLVTGLDDMYNTTHFVVPVVVLVVLFTVRPLQYRTARNALAWTTAIALIGFALFPVMPPRLLPPSYHFVDTLRSVGGLWSFGSGPIARVSNQFAAMPSLHMAWSTWSAASLWPCLRRWWQKAIAASYPILTLLCITVTANHYFLDAVAGIGVFVVARVIANRMSTLSPSARKHRVAPAE